MAANINFLKVLQRNRVSRGLVWGMLILAALIAFEIFNYSTTEFAMSDLLGSLQFAGLRWSTILAIAFCGIDFAGIARLFTPEQGSDEPSEVWYLFGAWLLAATMNATLTWWGVAVAISNHATLGNEVVSRETLLKVVPIFVAVMVWLIRVLIIGTFSVAGERLFTQDNTPGAQRGLATLTRIPKAAPRRRQADTGYNHPSASPARSGMQASARSAGYAEPGYRQVSAQANQSSGDFRS